MNIFDRLLAGERVTLEAHGHRFDMTYGPAEDPCLVTYHGTGVIKSPPLTADVARAHFEEQAQRYDWRDARANTSAMALTPADEVIIAAHAEAEPPVAALIADAVAAVDSRKPVVEPVKLETPLPKGKIKVEAVKVKIAKAVAKKGSKK